MDKKQTTINTGIGVGGISILAIFVILCLVTLASLSLVSARADHTLARKTADAAQEYYQADVVAEDMLAELMAIADKDGNLDAARDSGFEVSKENGKAIVSYTVEVNEIKNLYVEIEFSLDASGSLTGDWTRKCWETQISEQDESGESLNLLQ